LHPGQYVLSPASAFWLFLASALYELPTMYKDNALAIILDNIPAFFVASFMGIGVNYLSYLVIQYTSSLTMKILGTVRNIILIFYGVFMHGEVTLLFISLHLIEIIFSFLFNRNRSSHETNILDTESH